MLDKAINYLKYLHALEIAAGMNFKFVFDDLWARQKLPLDLGRALSKAQYQEMRHAQWVRDMLGILGYFDLRELMRMPRDLTEALGAGLPEPWPDGMEAYARISFNQELESRFANGGVSQFYFNMHKLLHAVPIADRIHFIVTAGRFYNEVSEDEKWHVEIDRQVQALYHQIHDGFDMPGLLARLQVTRSPFIEVIRAKQEFGRALAGAAPPSSASSVSVEASAYRETPL